MTEHGNSYNQGKARNDLTRFCGPCAEELTFDCLVTRSVRQFLSFQAAFARVSSFVAAHRTQEGEICTTQALAQQTQG